MNILFRQKKNNSQCFNEKFTILSAGNSSLKDKKFVNRTKFPFWKFPILNACGENEVT